MYVLGKGIETVYPMLLISVIFIGLLVAEGVYYNRMLAERDKEIRRLAKWKSDHQQQTATAPLHHSEPGS
jgi:hypothetical protein